MTKKSVKKPFKKKVKVKKEKKVSVKKVFLTILTIIFALGLAFALFYIFTNSKFNIAKVQIKGNKTYTVEQIQEKIQVKKGNNIFRVTSSSIMDKLKDLPYIGDVDLDRNLPNSLNINIKERIAVYLAYNKETANYVRLSDEGIILEIVDRADKKDDELLTFGINFDDNIFIGEKIAPLEYAKIEQYNNVKVQYTKNKLDKEITSIKFENNNIILVLDYNLSVIFEEKDLSYDMSILGDILKEIEGKSGTIDMTKPDPIFTGSIN